MIVRPILSVLLTLTICAMHCLSAMAQERCATVEYEKIRKNPKSEKEATFEKWLRDKSVQSPLKTQGTQKKQSATYKIPIVVHVIHNGEPVGTGTNISDAQILSQITVMNDDYKRLNADQTNTPAEFAGVAGSIDIEFILAKQDPEGLASTGIVRVKGSKFSWTLADNTLFKSHSYWPAENYLNIWVLNLTDFLGYAQFPVSTLPGLEQSPNDRLTDGVAVSYEVFGSINGAGGPFNLDSRYNKGRTATHEIGHFLGLRHIWGDQTTCTDSDYVTDTPPQSSSTTNCAVHPQPQCSVNKMFQNYLDYTDDACMNLFTVGQISRMNTVLNNSPRRLSLLTSPGSSDPISVNNDLGIKEITSPALTSCGGSIIPSIEVRNYGSNQVTSTKIQFKLNSTIIETKDVVLNLAFPETTIVSFSAINLAQATTNLLNFEILETNGGTDGQTSNNLKEISVKVATRANLPISESFNTLPSSWTIDNPDGLLTWQIIPAVNGAPGNKAIFINLFDYENTGVNDKLVTPVYDFTNVTGALLKFSRSYAPYPGEEADRLKVLVSTNCNFESNPVELYNKSGSQLATTQNFSGSFVPTSANQWLTESISLNQFAGQANVQFAFVAVNGYGNNLFLDNVSVASGEFTDITLLAVESPSPVSCKSTIHPVIRVKNSGTTIISNFAVYVSVNEGQSTTQIFNDVTLETGEERLFTLAPLSLINESNSISIILDNPNGLEDVLPADNSQAVTRIINAETDIIPVRQNFDGGVAPWSIVVKAWTRLGLLLPPTKKYQCSMRPIQIPTKMKSRGWLVLLSIFPELQRQACFIN